MKRSAYGHLEILRLSGVVALLWVVFSPRSASASCGDYLVSIRDEHGAKRHSAPMGPTTPCTSCSRQETPPLAPPLPTPTSISSSPEACVFFAVDGVPVFCRWLASDILDSPTFHLQFEVFRPPRLS